MSVETARAFLDLYTSKSPLRTQFYVMNPRTPEQVLEYIRAKSGFVVSQDDLAAALKAYPNQDAIQLLKDRVGVE